MYIEMTTFAIPTILIAVLKGVAIGLAIWVGIMVIVGLFYPGN